VATADRIGLKVGPVTGRRQKAEAGLFDGLTTRSG
jgi:hypothetical protein